MSAYPALSAPRGLTASVFAGRGSLGAIEVGMLRESLDHGVHQCDCLIERAAEKTRAWLNEGGLERRYIAVELREHTHA